MSWEGFWLPNLIQSTVFVVLAAAVGLGARVLLTRWYERVVKPWLENWLRDVLGASTDAKHASESAKAEATAVRQDLAPALELREANGRLVALLPEKDHSNEYLKEQVSRLTAQLVIQASKHPEDFDSPDAPRPTLPGRHSRPPIEQDLA